MRKWVLGFSTPIFIYKPFNKMKMKKISLFLGILLLAIIGLIMFKVGVVMFKIMIGLGVFALIMLGVFIGRLTKKNKN